MYQFIRGRYCNVLMRDNIKGMIDFIEIVERKIPLSPSTYAPQVATIYRSVGNHNINDYGIQTNPFLIQTVDPTDISEITGREWKPWDNSRQLIGKIKEGDWDVRDPVNVPEVSQPYPKKFSEMPRYKAFREHFINGVPWHETVLFEKLMKQVHSNDDSYFSTPSEVDQFLSHKDRLFDQIKQNGYKTQLELSTKKDSYLNVILNEVLIDIGRDGRPLFVDGRHRLSIAKVLGINKIPVTVLVRHRQWVEALEQ